MNRNSLKASTLLVALGIATVTLTGCGNSTESKETTSETAPSETSTDTSGMNTTGTDTTMMDTTTVPKDRPIVKPTSFKTGNTTVSSDKQIQ